MHGNCKICLSYDWLHTHHIMSRGAMGKSPETDNPLNLLVLCGHCHDKVHRGQIPKKKVYARKAELEGISPQELREKLDKLRLVTRWNEYA